MKKMFNYSHGDWKPYAPRPTTVGSVDIILMLGITIVVIWFIWKTNNQLTYTWNWHSFIDFIVKKNSQGEWSPGLLFSGLLVTIKLGIWAIFLALIIGVSIGIPAAHKKGFSSFPTRLYINIVRNIPPLVLLFFLYFFIGTVIPISNLEIAIQALPNYIQSFIAFCFAPPDQIDRMITAVTTLGLYEGAYVAEIVRAGLESVPHEQWETSSALGFSKYIQLRHIILPQAIIYMLPALVGQSISTFKDSALASLISLPELTFQSLETMSISQRTFETWISSACLYLFLGFTCSRIGQYLEHHTFLLEKAKIKL